MLRDALASSSFDQRIAALSEALNYGDAGLDLVIQALQDESKQIKCIAYSLLQQREDKRVKQALQECSPWQQMTCLRTFKGHSGAVRSVAISPNRQTIVSGSEDGSIRVWDMLMPTINEEMTILI